MLFEMMLMLFFTSCVALVVGITMLQFNLDRLWQAATPERRAEYMTLCFYFYGWFFRLPINVSRAYMPLFQRFERGHVGFIFEGAQIIVYVKNPTSSSMSVAIGTRVASKRKGWIFDIGACGMVKAGQTPLQAAKEELYEELGLDEEPVFTKQVMPYQGYGCIIWVYKVVLEKQTQLASTDGTYEKISWVPADKHSVLAYMDSEVRVNPDLKHAHNAISKKDAALMFKDGLI
jgi:8-oxo-dGTP pyrophosphatase MutT (NUDIX family)